MTEQALGVRLIVGYKLLKALAELALAALLLSAGAAEEVRQLASALRDHATAAWSIALADQLVHVASGRHLMVVALASIADAIFSAFEGWALHRRYSWSRWLIVIATGCLLPFEVAALVRRFTAGRVVLLIINALIVAYLARRRVARETP